MTPLRDLYLGDAARRLYDEAVTELEHALQCADLAAADGADDALVAAALLHDVGHLLEGGNAHRGTARDDGHEAAGARYLRRWFGPAVTAPIALHVEAKRYLVAVDPAYEATLSASSIHSLRLQGGPMAASQRAAFEARPHAADAVRLRRWDDAAKVVGAGTSTFDAHLGRLARLGTFDPGAGA